MDGLKRLLFALADDELLMGHRASEWTGLGPLLEADLALSSIAQDEMGHALLLYELLGELGEPDPDTLVYQRDAAGYRHAIFCELPREDWGWTLVRQYLYDLAEQVRWEAFSRSSYGPLAAVSRKVGPEERYHLLHGSTWIRKLASGTQEARDRLQEAFDSLFPYAAGLWESLPEEATLVEEGVSPPMAELAERWYESVSNMLDGYLTVPALETIRPVTGGRRGNHGEHFTQVLDAMQLLHREIPGAKW